MRSETLNIVCDGEFAPRYGSEFAAGIDLYNNDREIFLESEIVTVDTKVKVEIPDGYVGLLFVRSSLGARGVSLANSVGVIDSDYRGYIKAKIRYSGNDAYERIKYGERILQLVIMPYAAFDIGLVGELSETKRGEGGFGSSGTL